MLSIYTDGSCLGNPGKGGWAFIVVNSEGFEMKSSGGFVGVATNNTMELMAVIKSLEWIISSKIGHATIYADSTYVLNGIQTWIKAWVDNGWYTKAGKPVKNKELWERLLMLSREVQITWEWVKGHNGDYFNEAVDELARKMAES